MKIIFTLLALLSLSGCAVGPLVGHETARTVGDNNHEIAGGLGQQGFVAKWNYGLRENWDIGIHAELFSIGLRTKYAFINGMENGFSMAAAAGIGESVGGEHYYGELLSSYMIKQFEPLVNIIHVRVKTDPQDFKKDFEQDEPDFVIESYKFNYFQILYGTRFWFNPNWMLSVEGSTFAATSSGLKLMKWNLFSAAVGYRF